MISKKRFFAPFSGSACCLILACGSRCDADQGRNGTPLPPQTAQLLEQSGKWQGEPEEAKLEGPYEDPRQQLIPFGRVSFYLEPWRAYMDTWPAERYLSCLGVNLKVPVADIRATARGLAEAGFCSARMEIGWGNLGYYNPRQIAHAEQYKETLEALKQNGLRPIILLNFNAGAPGRPDTQHRELADA